MFGRFNAWRISKLKVVGGKKLQMDKFQPQEYQLYVTNFGKTNHLCVFCISRNTNLIYLMHCTSPVVQYSHARYLV